MTDITQAVTCFSPAEVHLKVCFALHLDTLHFISLLDAAARKITHYIKPAGIHPITFYISPILRAAAEAILYNAT